MTVPAPSTVRTIKIYPGGRGPNMGLLGPNAIRSWPNQHPLSSDWSWLNATQLCADWGEQLLSPPGKSITGGDGMLQVLQSGISADGMQAGLLLTGGTPGILYTITMRLTGVISGRQEAFDVRLLISGAVPVVIAPMLSTINRDTFAVGGLNISPGN
jgi:hypothetical protein